MSGLIDIEVGFMALSPPPGDERVKSGVLPARRYASLTYTGSSMAGNKALILWAKANSLSWDC